jgi:hypothetical protein
MTELLSVLVLASSIFAAPPAHSAPALCSSDPAAVERANFASGVTTKALCTADCGTFADVSCSGTVCNAVNRSCPGERGHVTCDSTTTYYCPVCEPECTEGAIKLEFTGPYCSCSAGTAYGTPRDRYKCIGGQWVYQSSSCGAPFCQGF